MPEDFVPANEILERIIDQGLPNSRFSIRGFDENRERVYLFTEQPAPRYYRCAVCTGEIALAADRVKLERPNASISDRRRTIHPACVSTFIESMVRVEVIPAKQTSIKRRASRRK